MFLISNEKQKNDETTKIEKWHFEFRIKKACAIQKIFTLVNGFQLCPNGFLLTNVNIKIRIFVTKQTHTVVLNLQDVRICVSKRSLRHIIIKSQIPSLISIPCIVCYKIRTFYNENSSSLIQKPTQHLFRDLQKHILTMTRIVDQQLLKYHPSMHKYVILRIINIGNKA